MWVDGDLILKVYVHFFNEKRESKLGNERR